jgi:hypothetical protein
LVQHLNISRLDSGDYLVSEEDGIILNGLKNILVNAQIEDVDHLFGHIKALRDIFVTSDAHFLDHKETLLKEYKVKVLCPYDTIQRIKNSIHTGS